jgi:hypothetical protein
MLEEAEMSQIDNAVTSSSKTKRVNRKGNLYREQRNRKSLSEKETHKAINVYR